MSGDTTLFEGSRFRVVRRMQELPNGTSLARDVILHPGAVTILPRFDDGRVLLIRNNRPAVGEILLELPAGTLEPGEDPLATAHRELAEETGFRAESVSLIHSFWMSPGILCERMHLFLADGLRAGETNLDAGELIEPIIVSWHEALLLIKEGQIQDAKTLVGLLWYDRWLRER